MKKMHKITIIILCVSVFLITSVATSIATEKRAMERLAAVVLLLQLRGWDYRDDATGRYLSKGEKYVLRTTLFRGNAYKLIAAGDDSVEDLDITIYDERFNEIDKDSQTDALPVVNVIPRWTGTFYIEVKMYDGHGYSKLAVCYQ